MGKSSSLLLRMLIVSALCFAPGCERDERQPPPELINPQTVEMETSRRPTTQELTDGPRQELRLDFLPVSISVPTSWELKTTSGEVAVTILSGPTPHGDAAVRLSRLNTLNPQTVELYLGRMKQDAAAPGANLFFEIRDQGGMRVVESVRAARDSSVDWKLRLLVSNGINFDQYELSFLALPRAVYDADSAFLRSLLTTVRLTDASSTSPGR